MNYTGNIPSPAKLIDIESMADVLKFAGPKNWLLIDPQGRVWRGENPMQLAAQAIGAIA